MITHLTKLILMLQNDLPFQMMATFGTSPQIMAPIFNMFCVALLGLALTYLIYMIINDTLQRPFFNFQVNNPFYEYRAPRCYSQSHQHHRVHMHTHDNPTGHSHRSRPSCIFNPLRTSREIHQHPTQESNSFRSIHGHA